MIVNDRRTPEQMETHRFLVVMTDRFLSGWGMAKGGTSVAAWACKTKEEWLAQEKVIRARSDAKRVRTVYESPRDARRYRPRNAAHFSVYVVGDE